MMHSIRTMSFIVVAATLVTVAFNGLANALPLNGLTTGEISDSFNVLFVPAGYVFSIWGLIYLGMLAFSVYQLLPSRREDPSIRRIRVPFLVSCAANIAWLFLWHHEQFVLTLVAMAALLLSLIAIYLRLRNPASDTPAGHGWLVRTPFSIYLGWVSVATIANVSTVLTYLRWDGFGLGAVVWTVIMLAAGIILGALMSFRHGDFVYGLVLVWAFAGIAVKHADIPAVCTAAWIAAGLAGIVLVPIAMIIRRRRTAEILAGSPGM